MKKNLSGVFLDGLLIFLIILLAFFLFFWQLGQTSLAPWDEAWYAEIARNILKSKNLFLLSSNGQPYIDHPPLGFWLISFSFKIFGMSEFAARLPMALAGLGSLLLTFLIGKKLFQESWLAFCASLVLATMPWFWLRVRTANLDALLVFLLLACLYLALKSVEEKRFFSFLGLFLGLSFLTKTLVAAALIPVVAYILLPDFKKIKKDNWWGFLGLFFLVTLPWYLINFAEYGPYFLKKHFLHVGLRLGDSPLALFSEFPRFYFSHSLYYLHMGILLWYKLFLLAFLFGIIFLKDKGLRSIYLWIAIFLILFSTSGKTELWHLIPVYPAIALLIPSIFAKLGFSSFSFLNRFLRKLKFPLFPHVLVKTTVPLLVLLVVSFTGLRHVKGLGHDIVKVSPPSQEEILARELSKYEGDIFFDDDYLPVVVFYSGRQVSLQRNILGVFEKAPRPFLFLTKRWLLEKNKIGEDEYEVLFESGERVIIRSLEKEKR